MKLSKVFSDFNTEVNNSVPYINANKTRLKIDTAQVDDVLEFLTDWNEAYTLYVSAATHTEATVRDVNKLYADFHSYLQNMKKQMKNNSLLELTGDDYTSIYIHTDKKRRKNIPRPNFAPANELLKSTHLVCEIFTRNPSEGHITEKKLPVDVAKIGRKLAVVPKDITPTADQYRSLEIIGRTKYNLSFLPEQAGLVGWLITFYINPRGEEGPPSEPYPFPII